MTANRNLSPTDEPMVNVWITPTVEREYRVRNVFPALRIEKAMRVMNTATGVFALTVDAASEVLADATSQCQVRRPEQKGLTTAYTSLRRTLAQQVQSAERRDTVPDPGLEEARKAVHESVARFKVGEACQDSQGKTYEIVGGYGFYRVQDDEGPYWHADGARVVYAYGYEVKAPGEEVYFVRPHRLWDADGEIKHLRLVR